MQHFNGHSCTTGTRNSGKVWLVFISKFSRIGYSILGTRQLGVGRSKLRSKRHKVERTNSSLCCADSDMYLFHTQQWSHLFIYLFIKSMNQHEYELHHCFAGCHRCSMHGFTVLCCFLCTDKWVRSWQSRVRGVYYSLLIHLPLNLAVLTSVQWIILTVVYLTLISAFIKRH